MLYSPNVEHKYNAQLFTLLFSNGLFCAFAFFNIVFVNAEALLHNKSNSTPRFKCIFRENIEQQLMSESFSLIHGITSD